MATVWFTNPYRDTCPSCGNIVATLERVGMTDKKEIRIRYKCVRCELVGYWLIAVKQMSESYRMALKQAKEDITPDEV